MILRPVTTVPGVEYRALPGKAEQRHFPQYCIAVRTGKERLEKTTRSAGPHFDLKEPTFFVSGLPSVMEKHAPQKNGTNAGKKTRNDPVQPFL